MDNTQREIRNEIEATRVGMVEKIATLEERVDCTIQGVKRTFDPKYQVQQHPWLAVGLSLAAGYLMSGLILGRERPKAELRASGRHQSAGVVQSLVGMLSGVVTATAVAMAREYASGLLFKRKQNDRSRSNGEDPDTTGGGGQRFSYRR
jgi:hypothetical protein